MTSILTCKEFIAIKLLNFFAAQVFDGPAPEPGTDLKVLHAKIGQLTLENDFLEGALIKAGKPSAKR